MRPEADAVCGVGLLISPDRLAQLRVTVSDRKSPTPLRVLVTGSACSHAVTQSLLAESKSCTDGLHIDVYVCVTGLY